MKRESAPGTGCKAIAAKFEGSKNAADQKFAFFATNPAELL